MLCGARRVSRSERLFFEAVMGRTEGPERKHVEAKVPELGVTEGARQQRVALARDRRVGPHCGHRPLKPRNSPADKDERVDVDGRGGKALGLARVEPILGNSNIAVQQRVGEASRKAREGLLQAANRVLEVLEMDAPHEESNISAQPARARDCRRRTFISASRFASIISFCVG